MPNSKTSDEEIHPRPRRKFLRWIILAGFFGLVVWLNGPGLRWLAPMAASHFLSKAGIRANFTLEGNLSGGFFIKDLDVTSDQALGSISVSRIKPDYQFFELLRGQVRGIEIDGAHIELRLGLEKPDDTAKAPQDLEKTLQSLRQVRLRTIPLSINLRNISLSATRDGRPFIALAKSTLHHAAGDSDFKLDLGTLTDASGREWPAQQTTITWGADKILLDRLNPLPGVGLRDLFVTLPETGGPSAEAELHLNEAVFYISASPGFSSIGIDLREGRLASRWLAERFAVELPAAAELTSLSLNLDDLLPAPRNATGSARFLLENIVADDWTIPELSVDAGLQAGSVTLAASGRALDTGFSLTAETPVSREAGGFMPGDVRGQFNVEDVSKLLAALSGRLKLINPEVAAPDSVMDGIFTVSLDKLRPAWAEVDLKLKPVDPQVVSPVSLKARWQNDDTLSAAIEIEGMKATADYQIEKSTYRASAAFDGFSSARVERWLAVFNAGTGGVYALTGKWNGSGDIKSATHRGKILLADLNFTQEGRQSILTNGELSYNWPAGFSTENLTTKTGEQSITLSARLADGLLKLENLRWQDGGREIAKGGGRLPMPADFSKWRDTLARDTRPLELGLESGQLPLVLLKDWLPAASQIDARSTGRVSFKVSGTYAEPVIDAVLEARDLRSPEQPKLPPADLRFTVSGRDGRLSVAGSATAPDFPAATMTASMPFRPAAWAENPGSILDEKISARADLPRLDLSRFASLVTPARRLSGAVTGNIEAAGNLGKPELKGRLDLTNGGLELKDARIAPVSGISASVDLAMNRITLRELRATSAGGLLRGDGTLALEKDKPAAMDFRVMANHLPLVRNDSMIVRANADLRLRGGFKQASLTGDVGIVDSLFYRDIELLPIGMPFTTPSAAALPRLDRPANRASAMPEPLKSWALDVRVGTVNPFLIRGNFAKGSVTGSVRIGGMLGKPAPDGELRIANLRAALPFSTLTVKSGTLRFTPDAGFDPVLEIRGTSEPRPYRVNGYVYGRASDPQLVLTSSPPLPENEIMTLLATGTTTSGLEDPQAASSRAMQLLIEELRRGRFAVGRQLRPLLGLLDNVDFSIAEADPYSNESFSTATLAITDHWFLSAGMGADGDSRFLAIWRLSFH